MIALRRFHASRFGIVAASMVAALLAASVSPAAVPSVINYQGRLLDNSPQQNPVDATVTMELSIWDASTGGASLWSETASVQVVKGLFNVLLGSTTPIPPSVFTGGATRYLEIHVSGETLTPRQRIAATPFASQAAAADDAGALGGVAADAYQRRIADPCPAGFSINSVGADGTTTCIQGTPGPQGPPGPGLETGAIKGKIVSCEGPTTNSVAYVPGQSFSSHLASDGSFRLSYLPAGTYDVEVQSNSSGGILTTLNVAVSGGQTTDAGTINWWDLSRNEGACGACGAACSRNHISAICQAGSCESGTCDAGWTDCNGNKRTDGCETNLATNANNCGACGAVCSPGNNQSAMCSAGHCSFSCTPPFWDCDGIQANGCETNPMLNDAQNCGNCHFVCSPNHVPVTSCSGGNCNGACETGFADCNGNKGTDGCETNINTSNSNCGSCGHACTMGTTCNSGVCS